MDSRPPIVMVDEFRMWKPRQRRPFHLGSCHLTVDGLTPEHLEALHVLATKIGLKRSWFQPHRVHPHYDLNGSKRTQAIAAGAIYVSSMDQARERMARLLN